MLQLQQAKQTALTNLQVEFSSIISQIAANRAQTEQQRSASRLQALQGLQQQAYAIKQQDMQFKQQLELMRQQALLNIQTYNQTAGASTTAGANAFNQFNTSASQPYDFSKIGVTSFTPQTPQYIGQIGKYVIGKDQMGRTLYSDGTAGLTQWQ